MSSKTKSLIIKSYVIAASLSLWATGVNVIIDLYSPYNDLSTIAVVRFHFLSALAYAVPLSFIVFYVIRNPDKKVRLHKTLLLIFYASLITVGGILGQLIAFYVFFPDGRAGLEAIPVIVLGFLSGAIILPLLGFFVRKMIRSNRVKS